MEGDTGTLTKTVSDEPHQKSVNTLLDLLGTYSRAPNGYWNSWTKTADNSIAKVFADNGGFYTWFTYFAANSTAKSQKHLPGKAKCCKVVSELEEQSLEYWKTFAQALRSTIDTKPDIQEKIRQLCKGNKTCFKMLQSNKRQR